MSEITTAAYKPMHYMVELPCDFYDTIYILTEDTEIEEASVIGFVVRKNGVAFETSAGNYYYLGKNAFLTEADAIGEQMIVRMGIRR